MRNRGTPANIEHDDIVRELDRHNGELGRDLAEANDLYKRVAAERDLLRRDVERLSTESATARIERQRFKDALERVAANPKADSHSWRTAHDALMLR